MSGTVANKAMAISSPILRQSASRHSHAFRLRQPFRLATTMRASSVAVIDRSSALSRRRLSRHPSLALRQAIHAPGDGISPPGIHRPVSGSAFFYHRYAIVKAVEDGDPERAEELLWEYVSSQQEASPDPEVIPLVIKSWLDYAKKKYHDQPPSEVSLPADAGASSPPSSSSPKGNPRRQKKQKQNRQHQKRTAHTQDELAVRHNKATQHVCKIIHQLNKLVKSTAISADFLPATESYEYAFECCVRVRDIQNRASTIQSIEELIQAMVSNNVLFNESICCNAIKTLVKNHEILKANALFRMFPYDNSIIVSAAVLLSGWSQMFGAAATQERLNEMLDNENIAGHTILFTVVMTAWKAERRPDKVQELMMHIVSKANAVGSAYQLDYAMYRCALHAWSESREATAAEQTESVLTRMRASFKVDGYDTKPTARDYECVIMKWTAEARDSVQVLRQNISGHANANEDRIGHIPNEKYDPHGAVLKADKLLRQQLDDCFGTEVDKAKTHETEKFESRSIANLTPTVRAVNAVIATWLNVREALGVNPQPATSLLFAMPVTSLNITSLTIVAEAWDKYMEREMEAPLYQASIASHTTITSRNDLGFDNSDGHSYDFDDGFVGHDHAYNQDSDLRGFDHNSDQDDNHGGKEHCRSQIVSILSKLSSLLESKELTAHNMHHAKSWDSYERLCGKYGVRPASRRRHKDRRRRAA